MTSVHQGAIRGIVAPVGTISSPVPRIGGAITSCLLLTISIVWVVVEILHGTDGWLTEGPPEHVSKVEGGVLDRWRSHALHEWT